MKRLNKFMMGFSVAVAWQGTMEIYFGQERYVELMKSKVMGGWFNLPIWTYAAMVLVVGAAYWVEGKEQ